MNAGDIHTIFRADVKRPMEWQDDRLPLAESEGDDRRVIHGRAVVSSLYCCRTSQNIHLVTGLDDNVLEVVFMPLINDRWRAFLRNSELR